MNTNDYKKLLIANGIDVIENGVSIVSFMRKIGKKSVKPHHIDMFASKNISGSLIYHTPYKNNFGELFVSDGIYYKVLSCFIDNIDTNTKRTLNVGQGETSIDDALANSDYVPVFDTQEKLVDVIVSYKVISELILKFGLALDETLVRTSNDVVKGEYAKMISWHFDMIASQYHFEGTCEQYIDMLWKRVCSLWKGEHPHTRRIHYYDVWKDYWWKRHDDTDVYTTGDECAHNDIGLEVL